MASIDRFLKAQKLINQIFHNKNEFTNLGSVLLVRALHLVSSAARVPSGQPPAILYKMKSKIAMQFIDELFSSHQSLFLA